MGISPILAQFHGLEHITGVRMDRPFPCSLNFNILSAEIPMVFGTYNISAIPSSAREVEVSQYMQGNPFLKARYCLD